MSNNVSSSSPANQPDKKGKEKVNFDEMNKDKQILVNEPNVPNNMNNKRKAIMLGDDHDHPNTDGSAAVTEDGSDSTKEQEPNSDKTLIIGSQNSQKKKISYNCTFCDKSFSSAQALGGHQNGHRMERMQQSHNKNSSGNDGIQLLNNMTMGAVGLNDAASVNPGPGGTSQHPRPAMAAVEISRTRIGNNNNNNNGGVERQIVNEACETPQGEFEFVLLPCAARNNENNMVEIDFGLVPKKDENGEAKEKAATLDDCRPLSPSAKVEVAIYPKRT
ncbi:hypothetical protein Ahy_A06g028739 [Arachis hypogaea]|uniref:C2H2-type domain-containing protein n=1 Tax=Arachis hypogaea TaxID=3818 RepID=A0A445CRK7_ARAHY|nr:hypothetical protein Ahy_A06g028739 [Arachis hypogaea]